MGTIRVERVTKRFGATVALKDVSFEVGEGEFFTIIGPTKAGKTTTLRVIAGLETLDVGEIFINGLAVTSLHPSRRKVSLLFQNLALFPHYTGFENIAFPLRIAGRPESEVGQQVLAVAEMLRIPHLLGRLPRTFSGGEQQRVAIGRAIIGVSEATLLDEPLSNLDARVRLSLRNELKRLHRDLGRTFVYVTHDQVEAMTLSDRILVLHHGEIQQIGTPDAVYNSPRNRFVAEFIGSPPMNLIPGRIEQDGRLLFVNAQMRQDVSRLLARGPARDPGEVLLGVRPEDVEVLPPGGPDGFLGRVSAIEPLGSKTVLDLECGEYHVRAIAAPGWIGRIDEPVRVRFSRSRLHLLDARTGLSIADAAQRLGPR